MRVMKFRAYLAYLSRSDAGQRDGQTADDRQTTDAATETEGSYTVSVRA